MGPAVSTGPLAFRCVGGSCWIDVFVHQNKPAGAEIVQWERQSEVRYEVIISSRLVSPCLFQNTHVGSFYHQRKKHPACFHAYRLSSRVGWFAFTPSRKDSNLVVSQHRLGPCFLPLKNVLFLGESLRMHDHHMSLPVSAVAD